MTFEGTFLKDECSCRKLCDYLKGKGLQLDSRAENVDDVVATLGKHTVYISTKSKRIKYFIGDVPILDGAPIKKAYKKLNAVR